MAWQDAADHPEDSSMIKLGRMLEAGTLPLEKDTRGKENNKMGYVRPKPTLPDNLRDLVTINVDDQPDYLLMVNKAAEKPEDTKVQIQVAKLLNDRKYIIKPKLLKHHMEHVIMIRLGTMLRDGVLTFEKYDEVKREHKQELEETLDPDEMKVYDSETDVFCILDTAIDRDLSSGEKTPGVQKNAQGNKDVAVQTHVAGLIHQNRIAVGDKELKHHMEHVVVIKLGKKLKSGTLTFKKYTMMKKEH